MADEKQYPKKNRVKLGALWHKETAQGIILSGKLEDGRSIVIFPNGYKKEAKHPDFVLYVEVEDGDQPSTGQAEIEQTFSRPVQADFGKLKQGKQALQDEMDKPDDEIPF